jgi:hypothetical protein
MRKVIFIVVFLFPVTLFAGEMVKVKVQKSTIFQEPKFFSKPVTVVKHGDELEMLDEVKDWRFVKFLEQNGWIHKSALTFTKVNLSTLLFRSTPSSPASEDEVALAGKGFNEETERGYDQAHPEVNYALVDEIERYGVEDDSLREFIERGGLKISEGKQ